MSIRGRWGALVLVMALVITGCTLRMGENAPSAAVSRAEAEAYLAALQATQRDALDLWARLIAGEEVSCAQAIILPPLVTGPADTAQAQQMIDRLSAARSALEQSAARWDLECAGAGEVVGLAAARVGQNAAHQATAPLQAAQALLDAWPPP